jgi:hypothetical protein
MQAFIEKWWEKENGQCQQLSFNTPAHSAATIEPTAAGPAPADVDATPGFLPGPCECLFSSEMGNSYRWMR